MEADFSQWAPLIVIKRDRHKKRIKRTTSTSLLKETAKKKLVIQNYL